MKKPDKQQRTKNYTLLLILLMVVGLLYAIAVMRIGSTPTTLSTFEGDG